ncbi:MAG TPA: hypothetical protein GXZ29_12245 [Clostridiales bacterium]|nr:hypothetical protein [Clostridiales bacterium]
MNFIFHENGKLPKLAWCAVLRSGDKNMHVYHGSGVETRDRFFVEGAWNGDFEKGEFAKSCFFMGSGGSLQESDSNHMVIFATPTHNMERLYTVSVRDMLYISNSLPFILFMSDLRLDPEYLDYERDFNTMMLGTESYKRYLPLADNNKIRLHYYCNIITDDSLQIREEDKARTGPFVSFDHYYGSLMSALDATIKNAQSDGRKIKYGMTATISNGYDSAACAALARDFGCETALTFNMPEKYADDNGEDIAQRLGYKNIVKRSADAYMTNERLVEAEFLSSGELGSEIVFSAFENEFRGNLVFKGNYGDEFWEISRTDLNRVMRCTKAVISETSFIEFRLRTGYIPLLPVSFGATDWPSIHRISTSEEMKPYSVGGSYDRPIPRRILETRGVDRNMFGMDKKGAGFNYRYDNLRRIRRRMAPASYASFYSFYRSNKRKGLNRYIRWFQYLWQAKFVYINFALSLLGIPERDIRIRYDALSSPGAPSYLFNWGVHEMLKRYDSSFRKGQVL